MSRSQSNQFPKDAHHLTFSIAPFFQNKTEQVPQNLDSRLQNSFGLSDFFCAPARVSRHKLSTVTDNFSAMKWCNSSFYSFGAFYPVPLKV